MNRLTEVAPEVFVLRYPVLDVNATLVLGGEAAVVVDTLSTDAQAGELLAAVRSVTSLPLVLVNTHAHFDHCYGNAILADDCPGGGIWAHEAAATALREHGESLQRELYAKWLPIDPELAQGLAAVALRPPDRTVHTLSTMDIGGRAVELRHFGRGHTDGDLVVSVPDADVLLAGDLVEEGAPPSFSDAYPLDWPETVAELLQLTLPATVIVPGHGRSVDVDFVRAQHEELTALAWLIRDGHGDGATVEAVAAKAPFDRSTSLVAVGRGYAELAGRI